MEKNSPKLFNKYFIIVVLLVLAFTFYKSVFLKNFTVINTEPAEEEVIDDNSLEQTAPLSEDITDETNTSTSTATTSDELN